MWVKALTWWDPESLWLEGRGLGKWRGGLAWSCGSSISSLKWEVIPLKIRKGQSWWCSRSYIHSPIIYRAPTDTRDIQWTEWGLSPWGSCSGTETHQRFKEERKGKSRDCGWCFPKQPSSVSLTSKKVWATLASLTSSPSQLGVGAPGVGENRGKSYQRWAHSSPASVMTWALPCFLTLQFFFSSGSILWNRKWHGWGSFFSETHSFIQKMCRAPSTCQAPLRGLSWIKQPCPHLMELHCSGDRQWTISLQWTCKLHNSEELSTLQAKESWS